MTWDIFHKQNHLIVAYKTGGEGKGTPFLSCYGTFRKGTEGKG